MDVAAYRAQAEELARALNAAHLARHTGRTGADDTAALVEAHAEVVAPPAVEALLAGGHRRLARFAVEARVGARIAGRPPGQAVELVRHEARVLGWPSARAMWAQLAAHDLDALVAAAQELVRAAPPPWAGAGKGAATFPTATVREALEGAGVEVREVEGLRRAFTAALDPPHRVVVVVPPDADARLLAHEAGHAALLVSVDAGAPFEARFLVDRAEAEATAYAFEAQAGPPDPHRPSRLAAGLLRDLALLDHGVSTELVDHLAAADPLLHRADYLSALSTAPRTDLRFALRAS